jgi:glycerol-3-phosphate dehydrogenase
VEDVLVRRVRLFIETGACGAEAVGPVTDIMGDLLGWDRRRRAAETERYLELLQADTRALTELTGVATAGRETAG